MGNPPQMRLSEFLTTQAYRKNEIFNIGNKITWKIFEMPYYKGPPIMLTPAPIN